MKQVLQNYKTGQLSVSDVPAPGVEPGCVLVRTSLSLVSTGTERMVVDLAKKSLWGKAKARPDLVKKLMAKASRDGVLATIDAARRKLDAPLPLGYSCVGTVLAVGAGVESIAVGTRVACAGAKVANHAEVNLVPENLCATVPDEASDESAAFVTVGAIAVQGIRQLQPTLGETIAVIGLGLIGQLTVQLLKANGCLVIGVDLDPKKVSLAMALGADWALARSEDVSTQVLARTEGVGVDGVIITAATSSNDTVELAGDLCRDRGRIVAVGAVGMNVPRRPYYDKELTLLQSRSYGPGRYDPLYEEAGFDYPIGYVRWTERRNMQAFLQLCAAGKIQVGPLVSKRFDISSAQDAYRLIGPERPAGEPEPLGLLLAYPQSDVAPVQRVEVSTRPAARKGDIGVGFFGAGSFAAGTLIPALAQSPLARLHAIASGRGFTATHLAKQYGFTLASTDPADLLSDAVDAVFIATRHNLHASQAAAALRAGKHVFVEKPLALDEEGLREVLDAQRLAGRHLMVGFNRRFAPLARQMSDFFAARRTPLVMHYRVNAGALPRDSWIHDPAVGGGRIVGEGCHFIDFMSFLARSPATSVFARATSAAGGLRPEENVSIIVTFADGSVGTLHYVASGDAAAGKERIEVLGDNACAYLEDFRFLDLHRNGKPRYVRKLGQDKGHAAGVAAFLEAVKRSSAPPIPLAEIEATTRATFAAKASIASGAAVSLVSGPT